ncbi:hypothetical protein DSL72_007794 [Monilinia vaccinii-corymbosi]|uniref:Uncharacterized protein n=1 Tax=Monilinia vaccinii-corymbosi TaxID=61207 RepID=A0A8A3PI38_9HELO|nr:hypothetical protein DSL72_007794 [Monilinia vaccinii-corymbosi]
MKFSRAAAPSLLSGIVAASSDDCSPLTTTIYQPTAITVKEPLIVTSTVTLGEAGGLWRWFWVNVISGNPQFKSVLLVLRLMIIIDGSSGTITAKITRIASVTSTTPSLPHKPSKPTHIVSVGQNDTLFFFSPEYIYAEEGETVRFEFYPTHHIATSFDVASPCLMNGVYGSGFNVTGTSRCPFLEWVQLCITSRWKQGFHTDRVPSSHPVAHTHQALSDQLGVLAVAVLCLQQASLAHLHTQALAALLPTLTTTPLFNGHVPYSFPTPVASYVAQSHQA